MKKLKLGAERPLLQIQPSSVAVPQPELQPGAQLQLRAHRHIQPTPAGRSKAHFLMHKENSSLKRGLRQGLLGRQPQIPRGYPGNGTHHPRKPPPRSSQSPEGSQGGLPIGRVDSSQPPGETADLQGSTCYIRDTKSHSERLGCLSLLNKP